MGTLSEMIWKHIKAPLNVFMGKSWIPYGATPSMKAICISLSYGIIGRTAKDCVCGYWSEEQPITKWFKWELWDKNSDKEV